MRSVDEWIGKTDDSPIPPRVRLRIFERTHGHCCRCGVRIVGAKWQADHITALINGGENRETNLQTLCLPCHSLKTKKDVKQKSKSYRIRLKDAGIKRKKRKMGYRKFDGTVVPPRWE